MKFLWSPRAIERATEIARHIALDDPAAAERWVDAVFDTADAIPPLPLRAARVPEVERPDVRQVFHGSYRVIFRFDDTKVEVLTVRHGAQRMKPGDVPPLESDS